MSWRHLRKPLQMDLDLEKPLLDDMPEKCSRRHVRKHFLTTCRDHAPDDIKETPCWQHAWQTFLVHVMSPDLATKCQERLPDNVSGTPLGQHVMSPFLTTTCQEPLPDSMSRPSSWQHVMSPFLTTTYQKILSWQHVKNLFLTACHEPRLDDNMSGTPFWQRVRNPFLTTCQKPFPNGMSWPLPDGVSRTSSTQHVRNPFRTMCPEPLPDNMSDPHLKACFEPFPRDVSGTPSWRNVVFLLRTLSGEMVGTCSWQYIHIYIDIVINK